MNILKKILSFILATTLMMLLVSCTTLSEESLEKTELEVYVEENKEILEESFKEGFTSSGLNCVCSVYAEEYTLYFECNVEGIEDVPDDIAAAIADAFEPQKEALASDFASSIDDDLRVDAVVMKLNEEDGDLIASLTVPIE